MSEVNTSGSKQQWETGAQRDSDDGKSRPDLIPACVLMRIGHHLAAGARHYGEHNWLHGIPDSRFMASLMRHVCAINDGDETEDHLSAAIFNLMGIMYNEIMSERGSIKYAELRDLFTPEGAPQCQSGHKTSKDGISSTSSGIECVKRNVSLSDWYAAKLDTASLEAELERQSKPNPLDGGSPGSTV